MSYMTDILRMDRCLRCARPGFSITETTPGKNKGTVLQACLCPHCGKRWVQAVIGADLPPPVELEDPLEKQSGEG